MGVGVARVPWCSPRKIHGAIAVAGWPPGGQRMPRFVPLLRYLKCSLMRREVFAKRDLHRGECVNSVRQPIEVVDQHPDGAIQVRR